jgi:tRNA A-37 threonylcarbamoyl transferase component Bud32
MPTQPSSAALRQQRLNEIIACYLQAVEAGHSVDQHDLLFRHPDLARELRDFFSNRGQFELIRQTRSTSQARTRVLPTAGQGDPKSNAPTVVQPEAGSAAAEGDLRTFGDYELLEEIARGGMGVVWKACHNRLQRVVALKMILAGSQATERELQRFLLEAQAAAGLDHPHIVPIYETGEHDGRPFYTMKLIDGGSLGQRLIDGPLPPQQAATLLVPIARAVHHAHQRGILHRDLKPNNILLDHAGRPYVSDFGLARPVDRDNGLTRTGLVVGTPNYMAPEQAAGKKDLTVAVDVYSLGAILYQMLTGSPPFRGNSMLETLQQVKDREPDQPRQLNPNVDRDLAAVCLKCLNKDTQGRYPSAEALAEDLTRWLAGKPTQARPLGLRQRTVKWARRRPALAALLTALPLLLVSIALVLWQGHAAGPAQSTGFFDGEPRTAAVAVSGDGSRVASAGPDGTVRVWDAASREEVHALHGHIGSVQSVAFSPDHQVLASAGADGTIRFWDLRTGRQLDSRSAPANGVRCLTFSPDGAQLFAVTADGAVTTCGTATFTKRPSQETPPSRE